MWPVLSSRTAYQNPWITVREDTVRRPDASEGIYGVVQLHHPAVFVVAVSDHDEVLMVWVDRHTVGVSIEVPAGGTDGEDPLVAARRELWEESGWAARDWRPIGTMNALNGVCVAPEHVFLATGLDREGDAAGSIAQEGISRQEFVPWPTVLEWVASGRISDGETVAALMYAALALGRVT